MEFFVINLLNGISFGSILFLLAAGLSVILGIMGILNLAHGVLYMFGAYIGYTIAVQLGLNFGFAAIIGGLSSGLVGVIIERGFLSRLYKQFNEQVLLTFGFVYIIVNLSMWIWGPQRKAPFTAPLLSGSFSFTDWSYPKSRIFIILIGLVMAWGLWWLQQKTRVGAIVRAGMDDEEMTMNLGINLRLVSSIVFFLAAFVAGFGGVIGAQLVGVYTGLGMDVLVLALIVIVVGGVGSVQGALLGAMLIGILDAFGKAIFPDLAMFTMYLVMILILVVRPSGLLGRKLQDMGQTNPGPPAKISRERLNRPILYIVGCVILLILPLFVSSYIQSLITKIIIYAIFAMSLDLIYGYTGLFSLGHAAYMGIGTYSVGILLLRLNITSFWVVAPISILVATIIAAIFGIIALRVSGLYFLMITFALGELLVSVAIKWTSVTGGAYGLPGIPLPDIGLSCFAFKATSFYYFIFSVFVLCYFILYRLVNSPFGLALKGVRECEPRMESLGYNTKLCKFIAFVISGMFAGVAGVLFAYQYGLAAPSHLGVGNSAMAMFMVIIGGAGTLYGSFIGSAVIILLQFFISGITPQRWPLFLGGIFVISAMYTAFRKRYKW